MMCRPLRAVLVGHRYAIIVPVRGQVACAPGARVTSRRIICHTPDIFPFFPIFPLDLLFPSH